MQIFDWLKKKYSYNVHILVNNKINCNFMEGILKQDSCLPKKTKINYFLVAILFVIGTMFSISFSCFNNTKIGAEVSATEVTSVEGTEANKPVFHFDEKMKI